MEPQDDRRARVLRWALTLAVVGAALALFLSGAAGDLDVDATVGLVREAGAFGVVGYLVAFACVQPLGISGHVFVLAAALVWPPAIAFPLALAGALGSAIVSFAFARYVAYEWVQARLPDRVRRYEGWVVERGLLGLVLFRLLTFTMHPAQLMIGTLRVRFGPMVLATAIGFTPTIALDVIFGGELVRWLLGLS